MILRINTDAAASSNPAASIASLRRKPVEWVHGMARVLGRIVALGRIAVREHGNGLPVWAARREGMRAKENL